jgi:hypothetical protein
MKDVYVLYRIHPDTKCQAGFVLPNVA